MPVTKHRFRTVRELGEFLMECPGDLPLAVGGVDCGGYDCTLCPIAEVYVTADGRWLVLDGQLDERARDCLELGIGDTGKREGL